jgi:TPR repeat protein
MAANKGYANAIGALGYMYQFGLGVKQSYDDALSHYQHAISLGDNYCKKYVKMILNTQHYKEQPIKINEVANNQEPKEDPETSIAAFEVPEEFR